MGTKYCCRNVSALSVLLLVFSIPTEAIEPAAASAPQKLKSAVLAAPVTIDGIEAAYYIDTGADYLVIPEEIFKKLPGKYREVESRIFNLGNGQKTETKVYLVDKVSVAGCVFDNVLATVSPGRKTPLLGMSILKHSTLYLADDPPQMDLKCPPMQK